MEDIEFKKMMDELLIKVNNEITTQEEYKEQVEIRDALEDDLIKLNHELHEKSWQFLQLNNYNSTKDEFDEAQKEIFVLKARIFLRKDGLEKFYNQLIDKLDNRKDILL